MAKRVTFARLGRYGRLGNQMFQYAAGYTLAKELGVPFATSARAELHTAFATTAGRIPRYPKPIRRAIEKRQRVYTEPTAPHLGFDEKLFEQTAPIELQGFFQSERHFERLADEIAREFTPRPEHRRAADERVRGLMGDEDFGAVHVRRTDYVGSERFVTLSTAYAAACVARFPEDAPVLIVSDDPAWCRGVFVGGRFRFFETEAAHPLHDMLAISSARWVGIANSSFSWWGAWLGERGERGGRTERVFAPIRPFRGLEANEYTPPRWAKLDGPWWEPGPEVVDEGVIEAARRAARATGPGGVR